MQRQDAYIELPSVEPERKSAHHFDFDQTLTKDHVKDWCICGAPSVEEVRENLKDEFLTTFRNLLAKNAYISLITNGSAHRVKYYLQHAGFTREELKKINKIPIIAANSSILKDGFKKDAVDKLEEQWADAQDHYFYDDRGCFRREVAQLKKKFETKKKTLTVVNVNLSPDDNQHLKFAQNPKPDITKPGVAAELKTTASQHHATLFAQEPACIPVGAKVAVSLECRPV